MVSIDPKLYKNQGLRNAYCTAVIATFAASMGLLCALIWRDFILGLMKRYDIWDSDKGFETRRDILIAATVAILATLITALVVVCGAKLAC
jgi:hypothetical protein